jgi:hypothetical protein
LLLQITLRIPSVPLLPGIDPAVGRAGLEPSYCWTSNEAPLSPSYQFEEEEWGKKGLEEEEGEESAPTKFIPRSITTVAEVLEIH